MLFWTIVKVGLKALIANKVRSLLAMLGIIIGVGAVIALLAIGTGAKAAVLKRITAMGTNLLIVRPGQVGSGGVMSGVSQKLTLGDAQTLLRDVSGIEQLSPVLGKRAQVKFMNHNTSTNVNGVAPTYLAIHDMTVASGRAFSDAEIDTLSHVAILASATAANLFDAEDPLGQTVKINGMNFRVIGVLKAKGDTGFFNMDDQVLVPYTVAMKQLFGQAAGGTPNVIGMIDCRAVEGANLKDVQADMAGVMRKRHRLSEDAPDDFEIRNQADIIATMTQITDTLTYLLAGAAVISLLIGGIGIMNIMLVTVTERTREIGVRKAIGAKERTILLQFLLESVTVCGLGGLLGVGLGLGGVKVLALFPMFSPTVEWWSVLAAISISGAVGIFFGFYPAWRAAKLDPIEALRYE